MARNKTGEAFVISNKGTSNGKRPATYCNAGICTSNQTSGRGSLMRVLAGQDCLWGGGVKRAGGGWCGWLSAIYTDSLLSAPCDEDLLVHCTVVNKQVHSYIGLVSVDLVTFPPIPGIWQGGDLGFSFSS